MRDTAAVILAAGQGKRMRSKLPKVLHRIMGRPLIAFPVDLALCAGLCRVVVVVGHGREGVRFEVEGRTADERVRFAVQEEQRGTGHAVMCALPALRGHRGPVLILSGDVPLLDRKTIDRLKRAYDKGGGPLAMLSFRADDPTGYGRIIRENGKPSAVREHRDCSKEELEIKEVNAGIYLIDIDFLKKSVKRLTSDNDQNELYLTDLISVAAARSKVSVVEAPEHLVAGVNDREDLAVLEALLRSDINRALMRSGVTLRQPETITVEPDVAVAEDVEIRQGAHLAGRSTVGAGALIGAGAIVVDAKIGERAVIGPYSVIEGATVADGTSVRAMTYLRAQAAVERGIRFESRMEVKSAATATRTRAARVKKEG